MISVSRNLMGDVFLADGEISMVISKEYQNKPIGRRCIKDRIALAKEKGLKQVKPEIYPFNTQSQHMFVSVAFKHHHENCYTYKCE